MALTVRYSLRARHEEIELLEYVVGKFGQKKAKEIFVSIEKKLDRISKAPEMYRESNKMEWNFSTSAAKPLFYLCESV